MFWNSQPTQLRIAMDHYFNQTEISFLSFAVQSSILYYFFITQCSYTAGVSSVAKQASTVLWRHFVHSPYSVKEERDELQPYQ